MLFKKNYINFNILKLKKTLLKFKKTISSISANQRLANIEQSLPTYPVGESWKNGIYSTNTEKTQSINLQPISSFESSSDNYSSTSSLSQYFQESKKNTYCQDTLYFANSFKPNVLTEEKNCDVNVPASTSNIVQEGNGYSGTMTQQHSYQQHFVSKKISYIIIILL